MNAGIVTYPPGGVYGPRTQRDLQLVALHEGSVRVEIDGAPHGFEAGQVFLLRPGRREFFRFAPERPTVHSWVAARLPSPVEAWLREVPGLGPAPPALPLSPALKRLIGLAAALPPGLQGPGTREPAATLARAAVVYFWHELGLAASGSGRPGPRHEAVLRALDCMRRRLDEPLALSDLAEAAAVTPEHLCRLFRAELATAPMRRLWAERTTAGLHLLAATGLSVQEIAARCGFRSTFHFARRVRAAAGASPTAYRAARWSPGADGGGSR